MKTIALFFMGVFMCLNAQINQEDVAQAAKQTCQCFNKILVEMPKPFTNFLRDIDRLGKEEAQLKFKATILSLEPNKRADLINKLQDLDKAKEKPCVKKLEEDFKQYNGNKEFNDLVLKQLSKVEECFLVKTFIGQK